ncbi:MAG: DinB family protein [Pyrinomonadaceae bacterium]|nr:DinB family protein [Pyrinomonadaceae bacterium]
MSNELIESWEINGRIILYLLESIENEWLTDVSASKGRNVGEQFAHLHNVRLMWLKSASPELLEGLEKIEKGQDLSKEILLDSLTKSAEAISKLIEISNGKIKGFKPHATAFVGYLISHESHHRGQIMLSLKQSGRKLSKSVGFGIWEWGVR